MSLQQISVRYATALFNQAKAENTLDQVQDTLNKIGVLIQASQPLRDFIHNPLIDVQARAKVLTAVFEGKISGTVMKFLLFVSFKNRLNLLEVMIEAFDSLCLASQGRVRATVMTAMDIGASEKQHVTAALGVKYNKSVVAEWELNPALLGGFKIFIEGKLHDSSFSSQLEQYKQKVIL